MELGEGWRGGEDNGVRMVEGGKLMEVGAREGEIWGDSEKRGASKRRGWGV